MLTPETQTILDLLPWIALLILSLVFFRKTGTSQNVGDAVLIGLDKQRQTAEQRAAAAERALEEFKLQYAAERRELLIQIGELQWKISRLQNGRRYKINDTRNDRELKAKVTIFELTDKMSMTELQTVAFSAGVEWAQIGGEDKATKAMNLITMIDNRGLIKPFLGILKEERPDLPWPNVD